MRQDAIIIITIIIIIVIKVGYLTRNKSMSFLVG